jgi:hypothetical protein
MNSNEMYERFKNTQLGRSFALEGLRKKLDDIRDNSFSEPCILDFMQGRIFTLDEFFNRNGPSSLHWRDVAAFSLYSGDEGVLYRMGNGYAGSFSGFFSRLLDNLIPEGKMRRDEFLTPRFGDYLIDGRGIYVERCPSEGDSMGNAMVNAYYPQVQEDAIEYAKAFSSGFFTISKTVGYFPCK